MHGDDRRLVICRNCSAVCGLELNHVTIVSYVTQWTLFGVCEANQGRLFFVMLRVFYDI